jgi:hypothetical protein
MAKKNETIKKEDKEDLAGIAAVIMGTFIAMVMFVGIFMHESAWVLAPMASSFALMGIFLGYFTSRKK